jgi:xanthine dehydrogenase molybdenum-binding subunit
MKIKHSTIPSGTITAMDTTAAAAIPGVVAIITPFDIKNNPKWAAIKWGSVPALPYDKLRVAGEEIAGVVAEDPYAAEQACQAIKVTYNPTPYVLHPLTAKSSSAPQVYDGTNGSATIANLQPPSTYQFGNADAIFASPPTGAATFSATYESSHHQANNLIPWAYAVKVDSTGRTEMWSSNQYAKQFQNQIAGWLGVGYSRARCYNESGDSAFGDKKPPNRAYIIGTLLAQKTGRPVHYQSTHEDNLVIGNHRAKCVFQMQAVYQATAGAQPIGTILAIEGTLYGANSAFGGAGTSAYANGLYDVYKFPNFKFTTYDVYSNTPASGPIRCVQDPYALWCINNFLDEIAMKLGMNPASLMNLNNMYVAGDKDQQTGNRIASCGQPQMFTQAQTLSGYGTKWTAPPAGPASSLTGVHHGIGIANVTSVKGSGSATSGIVVMLGDGSVEVHADSNSLGQGRREELCIITAEQLGIPVSMVTITNYDSDGGTDTGVSAGSTQTKRAGNAVGAACVDLKNQMLAKAAANTSLGVAGDVTQLTYALDGSMKIFVTATPTKSVTFASLTGEPWLIGTGHYTTPTKTTQLVYATCVAEVDVDTDTGLVTVTNLTQVQDVGQLIYPLGIEGQAHGGMINGLNLALQEEQWPDTQTGLPIFYSHLDHRLALFTQTPPTMNVGYVNDPEQPPDSGTTVNNGGSLPSGQVIPYNFGAKGCGEPWMAGASPAIYSAFANATGVHIYELPMTPEKVLAALGKTNAPNGTAYGYGGGN